MRTFHATVKGLSLSSDDARHQLIKEWTADVLGWPKGKRCDSLKVFFARATPEESADLLAHVRAEMEAETQRLLAEASASAHAESTEEF